MEIKAPSHHPETPFTRSLFLAGGITGCPEWQREVVERLDTIDKLTIYNPRREDFDVTDPKASEAQIAWEFRHLEKCGLISFWFPKETLCPITLYELGAVSEKIKILREHSPYLAPRVFVGVEPGYKRDFDVREQTRLRLPDVVVVRSIGELVLQIMQQL